MRLFFMLYWRKSNRDYLMITKADLISGALQALAVDGLLLQPMADDQRVVLQHLDDMAATYAAAGLDGGYIQPAQYGTSTPADDSGVPASLAGPYKILLADYIASQYGKQFNPYQKDWAQKMLTSITIDNIVSTKYPTTLPVGSGNYDGPNTDVFYRGGLPL